MAINIQEQLKQCISTTTGNVTLIDNETGVQLFSETMKDIGVDFKEDNKKIEGGIGNPTIYSWGENRKISVNLSDAVSRMDWTAAKLGQEMKTGKVKVFKEAKSYTVNSGAISLDIKPDDSKKLKIFNKVTGDLIDISKATFTDNKVTFASDTIKDGTDVYVWGYEVSSKNGVSINIDSDKFAKTFEVIISSPVVIIENGKPSTKFIKQYRFPMGRLSGDFKDDLKSKSDGGKMDSKIEILKPLNSKRMGNIIIFPIESLGGEDLKNMGLSQ